MITYQHRDEIKILKEKLQNPGVKNAVDEFLKGKELKTKINIRQIIIEL